MAEPQDLKKRRQSSVFTSKFRNVEGAGNPPTGTSTQTRTPGNARTPRFVLPGSQQYLDTNRGAQRGLNTPGSNAASTQASTAAATQPKQFSSAPRFKVPRELDLPLNGFSNSPLTANRQQKPITTAAAPKTPQTTRRLGKSWVDEDIVNLYTSDAENDGIEDESPLERGPSGSFAAMGDESPISDSPVKPASDAPHPCQVQQDRSNEKAARDISAASPAGKKVPWTMALTPRSKKRDPDGHWSKRRRISPSPSPSSSSSSPSKRQPTLRREDSISTITSSPPGASTPIAAPRSPSLRPSSPSPGSDIICASEVSDVTPRKPNNSSPLAPGRGDVEEGENEEEEVFSNEDANDGEIRSPSIRRTAPPPPPPTFATPGPPRPHNGDFTPGTAADGSASISSGWKRPTRFLFNPAASTPTPPITPGMFQTPLRKTRPRFNIPSPLDGNNDPRYPAANFGNSTTHDSETLISPPPPSQTPIAPWKTMPSGAASADQQTTKKGRGKKNKPPKFVLGGMAAEARSWLLDADARKNMTLQMLAQQGGLPKKKNQTPAGEGQQQQRHQEQHKTSNKKYHAFTAVVVDAAACSRESSDALPLQQRAGHVSNFFLLTVDIQNAPLSDLPRKSLVHTQADTTANAGLNTTARRASLLLFGKQLSLPPTPTPTTAPAPTATTSPASLARSAGQAYKPSRNDVIGVRRGLLWDFELTAHGRDRGDDYDDNTKRKWTVALEWDVLSYGDGQMTTEMTTIEYERGFNLHAANVAQVVGV